MSLTESLPGKFTPPDWENVVVLESPMFRRMTLALAVLLLAGCGDPAPEQYHLSGTVEFRGEPIAGGMVYFEPAEGNSGHTGFARIVAGQFDTRAEGGKGHVGGTMAIRVEPGVNLQEPILDDSATPPPPPFRAWEEIVDLPKEDGTREIKVPDDADKVIAQPQPGANDP